MKADELLTYDSVRRWSSRVKLGRSQFYSLGRFLKHMRQNTAFKDITPDGLVELQKSPPEGNQYYVLDLLQEHINQMKGRYGTKKVTYGFIRSFMAHNRAALPKDPNFNIRGDVPPVNGGLTPEEIRSVLLSSNKLHRAIFLCMLQGALDLDMMTYWNENGWAELREQLIQNRDPLKISLPGRKTQKHRKPYYTFITTDAIKALRDYLPAELPSDRPAIFINQRGLPVTKEGVAYYWTRHLKVTGIIDHMSIYDEKGRRRVVRHGKNIHELRDVWRSFTAKTDMKYEVGEFFMGHTVDPLGYDKSFTDERFYRQQYMEASEYLNILSKAKAYGLVNPGEVENDKIKQLEAKLEEARRGQGDEVQRLQTQLEQRSRQLDSVEQKLDIVMRGLANPETAPSLWKALKEIEEKADR